MITDEGRKEILEAGQPIEAENAEGETEKVDLSLEHGPEGFEPENPLVELSIGAAADEGVEVGEEELTVTQLGAEESKGRLLGDKNVFFGEVEEGSDIDLLVSPTAHGVELFDMLRSAQSPDTLRFEVEVPEGDTLHQIPAGGAEIVDGEGEMVGMVPAPHAEDAQGTEVPVDLEVEGETIVLRTHHREEDLAYPILVDPEMMFQFWGNWLFSQNLQGRNYFGFAANTSKAHSASWGEGSWPDWQGLFINMEAGLLPEWAYGEFYINSPNRNVTIQDVRLDPFQRNDGECWPSAEPYDYEGYWEPAESRWTPLYTNEAHNSGFSEHQQDWSYEYVWGLGTNVSFESQCWRSLAVAGVSFHLYEWPWTAPTLSPPVATAPSEWITANTTFHVKAAATDYALGVKEIVFTSGGYHAPVRKVPNEASGGCTGLYESRCPSEWGENFTLTGGEFEEGENQIGVVAKSPMTYSSQTLTFPLKVDVKPPVLNIGGQFARAVQEGQAEPGEEQGHGGPELTQPVYNLTAEATDGVLDGKVVHKQSGVKKIEMLVDNELKKTLTNPSCAASSCGLKGTYGLMLTALKPGIHRLLVRAWDFAGNQPTTVEREFEYFPATGLTEANVTQRFPLPDGVNHGEGSYQGPELAVNVMNGNLVYRQRDIEVEGPTTNLEVELFYNSQLPKEESSEFGRGWTLSQTPTLEPAPGGNMATAMTTDAQLTGNVALPQEVGKGQFSNKLDAYIRKQPGGGYSVNEGGQESPATVFNSKGQATEVQTSPTAAVEYEYEGEHLSEIAVDDPGATTLTPPPVKKAPSIVPNYVSSFGAAGTGNGQLSHPADVALDVKGNEWVADFGNNRIEEFTPGGEFIKSLGTTGTGNGQFTAPKSLAFDASGNLWVLDSGNSRLEEFGPTGAFIRAVGSKGTGNGQFNRPEGVAIAPSGKILVSDCTASLNLRLVELGPAGEFVRTFTPAGVGLVEPAGIDIGPEGKIWMADRLRSRVVELSESGELIRSVGSSGTGEGQFRMPDAIAVGPLGEVWVGDQNNERVEELTKEGTYVTQFGSAGSGVGQFSLSYPMGIATDNQGSLFVADTNNNRVEHWQIPHFGNRPVYASSFGSLGAGQGQFHHPGDIAVDHRGNLWVPDVQNNRLQEFNAQGAFMRQLGIAGTGNGQFSSPKSISFTDDGEFWVADSGNSRLEEFAEDGTFLKAVGANGAGNGQFNQPEALAVAPNGHIWVADTYNYRIVELDENGSFVKVVNPTGLGHVEPTGIAFGPGANAWIADWAGNRVVEINPAGELVGQIGTTGSGNGQFNHPDTVAIDPRGIIDVVDQSNSRVQVFNQAGEYLSQFGSAGKGSGQFTFGYPTGIAADNRGNLWVADSENNRIEKWQTGSWVPAEEEVIPANDDPAVEVNTSAGLVTSVVGAQAGSHHYGHSGELLTTDEGPEGTTRYEYEAATGRLTKVTLPNGTAASIKYDPATARATTVTVTPAGGTPKSTTFSYKQETGVREKEGKLEEVAGESRETAVEPEGEKRTFYLFDNAGDMLRYWNVQKVPTFRSLTGSIYVKGEKTLAAEKVLGIGDQNFFVEGEASEGIKTIQVIANGTTIVDEKTCTGGREACKTAYLDWIVATEELPPGTMWVEAVLTNYLNESSSRRWWVTVPYIPPPPPGNPEPPKYKEVHQFREERGLDLELNPVADELELQAIVEEAITAWFNAETATGRVAYGAWERWGVPLRQKDVEELEYRLAYIHQDIPLVEQWARAHAWNLYGGYWVDERAGGLFRVGFTEHQAELVAQMKQELGGQLAAPDRITTFITPPTETVAQVEARSKSVIAYWLSHQAMEEDVSGVAFNPETNKVRVEAENIGAAEAQVLAAIGSLARVEFVLQPDGIEPASGRYRAFGQIKAGDAIENIEAPPSNLGACTAGFGAEETRPAGQPTKKFLLSAGHCFRVGEWAWRADNEKAPVNEWHAVGEVVQNALPQAPRPNETDAESLFMKNGFGLPPTEIFPHRQIDIAAEPAEWEPGVELCFSGIKSNVRCGISAGVQQYAVHRDGVNTGAMLGIKINHIVWHKGDSGGPVFNSETGRSVGLLSAGVRQGDSVKGAVYVAPLKRVPTNGNGVSQQGALAALGGGHELTVYPYPDR